MTSDRTYYIGLLRKIKDAKPDAGKTLLAHTLVSCLEFVEDKDTDFNRDFVEKFIDSLSES